MGSFYVVYNIQDAFPGAELHAKSYEIYDSEKSFLESLQSYLEYVKSLKLDVYEDYFDELPEEEEEYNAHIEMIKARINNTSTENSLYKKVFYGMDIELEILYDSQDITSFFEILNEDLLQRHDISDILNLEPEERKELYEEDPLFKYCAKVKTSLRKLDKKTFEPIFKACESELNENAVLLEF